MWHVLLGAHYKNKFIVSSKTPVGTSVTDQRGAHPSGCSTPEFQPAVGLQRFVSTPCRRTRKHRKRKHSGPSKHSRGRRFAKFHHREIALRLDCASSPSAPPYKGRWFGNKQIHGGVL